MDCQEFLELIEECDLSEVSAGEHTAAGVHVSNCTGCARQLEIQQALAALPVPPLDDARAAGWRVAALSAAHSSRQRMRGRLFLVGAVVAMAAAAAWVLDPFGGESGGSSSSVVVAEAVVAAPARESAVTAPAVAVPVIAPAPAVPAGGVEAAQPAGTFAVLLLPLEHQAENAVSYSQGEEFYSLLAERLRNIPGLVLLGAQQSQALAARPADFRIRVTSSFGRVPERFGGHEQWNVNTMAYARRAQSGGQYTQLLGISIGPECGRLSLADIPPDSICAPAGVVETTVQSLRRSVFPPDASRMESLQGRFLDVTQSQESRRQALAELIELRRRAPGPMSTELIRAVISDAIANAPNPAQRAYLWQALRGQTDEVMVAPLINMLHREGDDSVRLEMVSLLATDFSRHLLARSELETIAGTDGKLLLRKIAERAISGEAVWQAYVTANIADTSLSAAQRFEPLGWMMDNTPAVPGDAAQQGIPGISQVIAGVLDEGKAAELASVLATRAGSPSGSRMLELISQMRHPGAIDLLLESMKSYPVAQRISLLQRMPGDPRARKILNEIAVSKSDVLVREQAMEVLNGTANSSQGE